MNGLVIGAGGAGNIHAGLLPKLIDEVNIFDVDGARAAAVAKRHGIAVAPNAEVPADIAIVAVPAHLHRTVVEEQLALGRIVVVEKPLALRPEDARALAGRDNLYIAESQCYGGNVPLMRDRIRGGEFGRPVQWRLGAMTTFRPQAWCDDLAVGGGAFLEGGAHVLTTARVLFGEAVRWQGSVRCFSGGTGPDTGTLLIDYEDGDAVSLSIGWGTEGCITGACPPLHSGGALIGPTSCLSWWHGDNHAAMWRHLLRCIAGEAEPVATVADAAGAVEDVWRCYEASGVTL